MPKTTRKHGIYLASAYNQKDLVASYIKRLPSGLFVTHDWTVAPKWLPAELVGKRETELPEKVCKKLAEEDMKGVQTADVLWLLTPAERGCGCFIELGIALRQVQTRVIVSGLQRSIFQHLADDWYASHEGAFAALSDAY